MASTPAWFDETVYITNKLAQLKATGSTVDWNASTLKTFIESTGVSLYEHFQQYGAAENVSPNADFNVAEYLAAKAALMNSTSEGGRTDWTEASVAKAITDAGMTVWGHYQQFGSAEGVNPSNAFDANAYLTAKAAAMNAAGEKQADGSEWTADAVKVAITNANMSVFEHYSMFAGQSASEVAAGAKFPVAAANKVEPSVTFDPFNPANVGSSFELTDKVDTFNGTANSDTITGKLENLAGDTITDTNANDQDHMILDAGMAATVDSKGASVKGIENITINTAAVRDLEVNVTGFDGMQTLRVKPTADSFANLSVKGLTKATVDAATASSVTLAGGAATDDAVTVKLNNAAVAVKNTDIETLTISSDIATTVTLTDAATATVKTAGDGNIVLKMGVADAVSTHSVIKGNTGTLAVELTGTETSADTTKIDAGVESITLNSTSIAAVTANNGQNFKTATGTTAALTFKMSSDKGTNDNVNVTLADNASVTTLTAGADLENITINTAKGNSIGTLAGTSSNTATVTGSDKLELGTVTGFKTLDASAFTGTLKVTKFADMNLLGGTGTNVAALDVTDGKTTFYKGTGEGVDTLTVAASGSGTVVVDAGAGKDSVALGGIVASAVASIDLGAGDDTLTIGVSSAAASIAGEVIAKAGEGNDTITLESLNLSAAGKVTVDAGAGNDAITLSNVVVAAGGTLTINAGAGDDTFTLDTVATTGVTLNGGEGNDTLTLKGATYSGITIDSIEHIKLGAETTTTLGASMLSGKTLDISTNASALTVAAAATDTVIDLSNVTVKMTADTIDLSAATLATLTKVVGTNANDTFEFGTMASGVFTGTLDGGTGTDTLSIGADASAASFDLKGATVAIDAVTFGGGDTANALTVGNNFAGTNDYSLAFVEAAKGKADSFTIDLTTAFTSTAAASADKVLNAGDWFVAKDTANLIYRDDDGDLITVHLTGVASTSGIVGTSGDLVITGAAGA